MIALQTLEIPQGTQPHQPNHQIAIPARSASYAADALDLRACGAAPQVNPWEVGDTTSAGWDVDERQGGPGRNQSMAWDDLGLEVGRFVPEAGPVRREGTAYFFFGLGLSASITTL